MKYMPAISEVMCQHVSALLYHLTRPANHTGDATQYLFGWVQDVNGQWYMQWDTDMVLPVHASRSAETLAALGEYVAAGLVSQESATALAALVQERSGSTVTLGEITPPEWAAVMVDSIELFSEFN